MENNFPCIQQTREEETVINENLNGPFENKKIMFVGNIDPNSGMRLDIILKGALIFILCMVLDN